MRKYNDPQPCADNSFGFADYGNDFGWADKSHPVASIEIPKDVACNDDDGQSNPLFYVIYRKTHFFTETPRNSSGRGDKMEMLREFEQSANEGGDDDEEEEKVGYID
jgi:hypothetical protein